MGMGRVRRIIGTDGHDDLPLQTFGRVSPGREPGEVHRFSGPAEGGGGNNVPFFKVVGDLGVVLGVVFCEEGRVQDFLEVHRSRLVVVLTVVGGVRPGNESDVLVRVIVLRISYRTVLPREFMWRGGERGGAIVVLDGQLARRRHRTKRIAVRVERVKVEPELGSADAIRLSDESKVVDVVFRRRGGGLASELLFLEQRLRLRLWLGGSNGGGSEHRSPGSDDGVRRSTSPLGK